MKIRTSPRCDGQESYDVEFVEKRLEDVVANLNKYKRKDEKPFEVVAEVSDFNQRLRAFRAAFRADAVERIHGQAGRDFHPMRFQRWAFSDINPWLAGWRPPPVWRSRSARR